MAINLNTLTSPATSGDVLAEALTTADFLEGVPVLRNLARGSQKGGDAKQGTALNQPKALPLTADSNGVVGGYLYQPDVTGNAPAVNIPSISANEDFVFEIEVYLVDATSFHLASGADANNRFGIYNNAFYFAPEASGLTSPLSTGASTLTVERSGTTATLKQDGVTKATHTANISDNTYTFTHLSFNGQYGTSIGRINGYIKKATLSIEGTEVFNCDFTATNVRHGDTKFKCATGQVVTINKSGNDPATIIKKPVLRFDGVNDCFQGLFNQTIDGGYMFAAFSVLGDSGEAFSRIFSVNSNGADDNTSSGGIFSIRNAASSTLDSFYQGNYRLPHVEMLDDANGDILHEVKITNGNQSSLVNDANLQTATSGTAISSEGFNIVSSAAPSNANNNAAIDLEYLALFPATITDAQADDVRNYINNRNNVFDLKDGFGYYFFESSATSNGQVFSSGGYPWNGRIVGSDNGDTNRYLYQDTLNDRPTSDGYKITFADNTDHFNIASTTQAGWQVVGTSLGTFAYRVNNTAVTELNLLGNLGSASRRKAGQSYGMILLPESATGADIEDARKLLIDRGASDAANTTTFENYWRDRGDIVEFQFIDTSTVTDFSFAWFNTRLTSFPFIDTSNGTNFFYAFYDTRLASFPALDMSKGTNFSNAWNSVSTLSSFPAGAQLGTAATGTITFDSAWNSSGLTSFSTPLPTATSASIAWGYCSALTQFNLDSLPVVLNVSQAWRNTGLTSFNTNLPSATSVSYAWYRATSLNLFGAVDIKNCSDFTAAWQSCSALTSFPSDALLGTEANNVNFTSAWQSSGLTSFSTPLPTATNVNQAWYQCASLTSFSSELQTVTSANYAWSGCTSLTSFDTPLPLATQMLLTWYNCPSLTSFSSELPSAANVNQGWLNCTSLSDFSADVFANWNPSSITSGVFNLAWDGCTSLTAQSVENILTSIDASGKYGTATGASGGGSIDSGIDIDYDGTTLSSATDSAITSLRGKSWVVYINGVERIP